MGSQMPISPRRQLHHQIRNAFSGATVAYFRAHPERLHDPVADEDVGHQLRLLDQVLTAVDEFEISVKVPAPPSVGVERKD